MELELKENEPVKGISSPIAPATATKYSRSINATTALRSGPSSDKRKSTSRRRSSQNLVDPASRFETPTGPENRIAPKTKPAAAATGFGRASRPLSEAALQDHTRGLEAIEEARRLNGEIQTAYQSLEQSDRSEGTSESSLERDPWTAFTQKWGYLPPLDDEVIELFAILAKHPGLARKMGRISSATQTHFQQGLKHRNVSVKASSDLDVFAEEIKRLAVDQWFEEEHEQTCYDKLWELDQLKCHSSSSEALFQRTLMVNLVARHFLIYQREKNLPRVFDFNVEEPWTCLPMPTEAVAGITTPEVPEEKFLTQPKPDLALCFTRDVLIDDNTWDSLPVAARALACTENMHSSEDLVFHFLTIEAKSAGLSLDDATARNQSLNNASQALFNTYEFLRDAGYEDFFYQKVRFFSVVAARGGMLVRVHRAVQIPKTDLVTKLVIPEDPSYRLKFEFREYARIDHVEHYNRARIFGIIKPILQYARDTLHAGLKIAARDLATKLSKDLAGYRERQHVSFYRHGQPSPKSTPGSKKASKAGSRLGGNESVSGPLGDINLGTGTRPQSKRSRASVQSSPHGTSKLSQIQSYPNPLATAAAVAASAQPPPPPRPKTKRQPNDTTSAVSRKRGTSEMDVGEEDDLNNTDTQGSSQSKRAKTSQ